MQKIKQALTKKSIISIILLTLLISCCFYFFIHKQKKATNPKVLKIVEVSEVKLQPLKKTIRLLGVVQPKHTASLLAKGDGRLDVIVGSGQFAKKGTIIASIDNVDIEKNLELSNAAADMAKARFEKLNELSNTGYVSKKEIEEKKQNWIDAAKEVSRMKIERDHLRIYAPFDGIVGAYNTRDGSEINQGKEVVQFFDPSDLVVDFDIPCHRYPAISKEQKATIKNKSYQLTHFQRMINPKTHMCPSDIDIDCKDCLLGETVDVNLVVAERPEAIVIPYHALFLKNNKSYVYIIESEKVVLKPVKTGFREKDKLEILSGLKTGQLVVTKAQERLYPGLDVKIYQDTKA